MTHFTAMGGLRTLMHDTSASRTRRGLIPLLAAALALPVAVTGCRDSAPEDLIQQETTTEALVFVKSSASETLNRTEASGNLFILSPIAPDGVVTPLTNFTGAAVSDPAVSYDGKSIHKNRWPTTSPSEPTGVVAMR